MGVRIDDTDPLARLIELLTACYRDGVSVKSDRARKDAEIVAMAASLQLITTKIGKQRFAKTWRITPKGLTWLNEKDN
jgi:hypothetical protein